MSKYTLIRGKSYKDYSDYKKYSSYKEYDYDTCSIKKEKVNYISNKIDSLMSKVVLSKIKQIIIEEMQSGYYKNGANIKEIIDINTHLMKEFNGGIDYMHVENLVIWQNGFYNFNRFNFTTPTMRKKKIK